MYIVRGLCSAVAAERGAKGAYDPGSTVQGAAFGGESGNLASSKLAFALQNGFISCIDFDIIRQNFYTASNLKDLFHNSHPKRIISFVHAIGLTNKL